jgi:zinc transport system substrate-binding protein
MGLPGNAWLIAFLTAAALAASSPALSAPVVVFVSVPPQASVVRDVGGPHVEVHCLVQAGQDPHVFEPLPKQMRSLGRARIFLTVGMPFERPVVEKIRSQLPRLAVVDGFAGFTRRAASDCSHDHASGHSDTDPHVWLSPEGLKVMAKNVAAALARIDPAHTGESSKRLKKVTNAIDAADARVRAKLTPYRGRAVYVFHPALGYFCDAYGLRQKAVEVDDKTPSMRQLEDLIRRARKDGARAVFVQEQSDQHAARAVAAAIGGRLVAVDPLAEDVVANLERIADAIASGLKDK